MSWLFIKIRDLLYQDCIDMTPLGNPLFEGDELASIPRHGSQTRAAIRYFQVDLRDAVLKETGRSRLTVSEQRHLIRLAHTRWGTLPSDVRRRYRRLRDAERDGDARDGDARNGVAEVAGDAEVAADAREESSKSSSEASSSDEDDANEAMSEDANEALNEDGNEVMNEDADESMDESTSEDESQEINSEAGPSQPPGPPRKRQRYLVPNEENPILPNETRSRSRNQPNDQVPTCSTRSARATRSRRAGSAGGSASSSGATSPRAKKGRSDGQCQRAMFKQKPFPFVNTKITVFNDAMDDMDDP